MSKENTFSRIYDVVRRVPPGKVATYGLVAALAGNPRLARVVGYALHVCPPESCVPCHRIVNRLGETAPGFELQRPMLEGEGVVFTPEGTVNLKKYLWDGN